MKQNLEPPNIVDKMSRMQWKKSPVIPRTMKITTWAKKDNELLLHGTTWTDWKGIMPGKRYQTKKNILYDIWRIFIKFWKYKPMYRQKANSWFLRARRQEWRILKGHGETLGDNRNVIILILHTLFWFCAHMFIYTFKTHPSSICF